jgi:hypothetical protein
VASGGVEALLGSATTRLGRPAEGRRAWFLIDRVLECGPGEIGSVVFEFICISSIYIYPYISPISSHISSGDIPSIGANEAPQDPSMPSS